MPTTEAITVSASQHYGSRYIPASMAQRIGAVMTLEALRFTRIVF